jgi:hypothetical protein
MLTAARGCEGHHIEARLRLSILRQREIPTLRYGID